MGTERTAKLVFKIHGLAVDLILTAIVQPASAKARIVVLARLGCSVLTRTYRKKRAPLASVVNNDAACVGTGESRRGWWWHDFVGHQRELPSCVTFLAFVETRCCSTRVCVRLVCGDWQVAESGGLAV